MQQKLREEGRCWRWHVRGARVSPCEQLVYRWVVPPSDAKSAVQRPGGVEGRAGAGRTASQSRLQAFCRARSMCVHTLQLILWEPETGEGRVCVWGALFLGNQGASLLAQMVKNPPAMRETWVPPLWLGRSPGGGHDIPLQHPCLENPMDGGAWRAAVLGVSKR